MEKFQCAGHAAKPLHALFSSYKTESFEVSTVIIPVTEEDSMDRGAWWATGHGLTKSWTPLSD